MNVRKRVLDLLRQGGEYTPTEIGLALGFDYHEASGKVSGPLRRLVRDGLVRRQVCYYSPNSPGPRRGRRVEYSWAGEANTDVG